MSISAEAALRKERRRLNAKNRAKAKTHLRIWIPRDLHDSIRAIAKEQGRTVEKTADLLLVLGIQQDDARLQEEQERRWEKSRQQIRSGNGLK